MIRALVTGGASPLGEAICRHLAAAGHHVTVHAYRNGGRAAALAAELGGAAMTCDIADVSATAAALAPCWRPGRCRYWCTTPASTTTCRWPA